MNLNTILLEQDSDKSTTFTEISRNQLDNVLDEPSEFVLNDQDYDREDAVQDLSFDQLLNNSDLDSFDLDDDDDDYFIFPINQQSDNTRFEELKQFKNDQNECFSPNLSTSDTTAPLRKLDTQKKPTEINRILNRLNSPREKKQSPSVPSSPKLKSLPPEAIDPEFVRKTLNKSNTEKTTVKPESHVTENNENITKKDEVSVKNKKLLKPSNDEQSLNKLPLQSDKINDQCNHSKNEKKNDNSDDLTAAVKLTIDTCKYTETNPNFVSNFDAKNISKIKEICKKQLQKVPDVAFASTSSRGIVKPVAINKLTQEQNRLSYIFPHHVNSNYCGHCHYVTKILPDCHFSENKLFTASRDGTTKKWDFSEYKPKLLYTIMQHTNWVNDLIKIPNHTKDILISCSNDHLIKLWAIDNNCNQSLEQNQSSSTLYSDAIETFKVHNDHVNTIAVNLTTPLTLVSGGNDGRIVAMDLVKACVTNEMEVPFNINYTRSYAPPKSVNTSDKNKLFNCNESGLKRKVYGLHRSVGYWGDGCFFPEVADVGNSVTSINWDSAERFVVAIYNLRGYEANLMAWDLRSSRCIFNIEAHKRPAHQIMEFHDALHFLTCSSDETIKLWDMRMRKCVAVFNDNDSAVKALAPASCGLSDHFYSAGSDGNLYQHWFLSDVYRDQDTFHIASETTPFVTCAADFAGSLWASTEDCYVRKYEVCHAKVNHRNVLSMKHQSYEESHDSEYDYVPDIMVNASLSIIGKPRLIRLNVASNQQLIVTLDAEDTVAVWDAIKGVLLYSRRKKLFENEQDLTDDKVFIKSNSCSVKVFDTICNSLKDFEETEQWFTADVALGCLRITLEKHKYNSCIITSSLLFGAPFNFSDSSTSTDKSFNPINNTTVNLGISFCSNLMYRSLLNAQNTSAKNGHNTNCDGKKHSIVQFWNADYQHIKTNCKILYGVTSLTALDTLLSKNKAMLEELIFWKNNLIAKQIILVRILLVGKWKRDISPREFKVKTTTTIFQLKQLLTQQPATSKNSRKKLWAIRDPKLADLTYSGKILKDGKMIKSLLETNHHDLKHLDICCSLQKSNMTSKNILIFGATHWNYLSLFPTFENIVKTKPKNHSVISTQLT